MVCLKKGKFLFLLFLIIAISIALYFGINYYIDRSAIIDNPPTQTDGDEDWNNPKEDVTSEFDTLYNLTEVPPLNKLFLNANFIQQITVDQLPYLYGFSADGEYAAFISYSKDDYEGYLIQIFNTTSGSMDFSIFLQNSSQIEDIIDTREYKLAQNALTNGYDISIPPVKLVWEPQLDYEAQTGHWFINSVAEDNKSYLEIRWQNSEDKWILLQDKQLEFNSDNVGLFTFPGKPEELIFLFNQNIFYEESSINYSPFFVNLDLFTPRNSEEGKKREADLWLYGGFKFLFNQWETSTKEGFFAVSSNTELIKSESLIANDVDQWVYLDPTGKMRWYGNIKGIFNSEVKPVEKQNHVFYYRVDLMYEAGTKSIKYIIINQYNKDTNKLIRTIEFKWNNEKKELIPTPSLNIIE